MGFLTNFYTCISSGRQKVIERQWIGIFYLSKYIEHAFREWVIIAVSLVINFIVSQTS